MLTQPPAPPGKPPASSAHSQRQGNLASAPECVPPCGRRSPASRRRGIPGRIVKPCGNRLADSVQGRANRRRPRSPRGTRFAFMTNAGIDSSSPHSLSLRSLRSSRLMKISRLGPNDPHSPPPGGTIHRNKTLLPPRARAPDANSPPREAAPAESSLAYPWPGENVF